MTKRRNDLSQDLEELRSDAEYMRFLVAAGELLSSSLDYEATLRHICDAAVQAVADICILDIGSLRDVEVVGAAHRLPNLTPQLEAAARHLNNDAGRPTHPVCRVLDTGQTFFAPRIDDAWIDEHATSAAHAAFMRSMKYRSMIVVPVRSLVWGIAGALTLVRTDLSPRPYDEHAILFAEDLGRRCGIAIGKARLHSQTLDVARRFQKAALPNSLPNVPGFLFDSYYEPADAALMVGGDWYDAFLLRDGNIAISIGDVSGHGLESAALMSSIRNAIRMGMVMQPDLSRVLQEADFLFRNEAPSGMYCTALVAMIERQAGRVRCASAGHPSLMVWRRGHIDMPLRKPSLPLGFGDLVVEPPETVTFDLELASTMLFYTDGLVEWHHDYPAGESAVLAALQDATIRNAATPARAIRDAVIAGAHADDVAILTVRYEGSQ